MENYFNYFTEIEEHYQLRRGAALLLSTLDWALIETWKNAGVPLAAVLRGIDDAFDKYGQRPSKSKKINSLAYCSQAVLAAAEDMKEAAVGASAGAESRGKPSSAAGFEPARIATFLEGCACRLETANLPPGAGLPVESIARETASSLRQIASTLAASTALPKLEDLERRLTVLEEKLFAVLMAAIPDGVLVDVRVRADRDMAPYRRNMTTAQADQLHKQYVRKRLLESTGIPRLSLFYMH